MIRRLFFVILALVVVAGYLFAQKTSGFNGFELADKTGKILRKPADYRDHYEILGAWTVLDPKGNQMHLTYVYASSGIRSSIVNKEHSVQQGASCASPRTARVT